MKYSHPLHFHKFVMQLNEPKWDGGSAEHSFRALCWSRQQTHAKKYAWRAPMSRHVSLAWVTPFPPLLMMNDWACPGLVFHYDGQTGVSFLCIKARLTQGWLKDADVSRSAWAFIQHKRHVSIQGWPMSLLFWYIMDIPCFNLRMFPHSMKK